MFRVTYSQDAGVSTRAISLSYRLGLLVTLVLCALISIAAIAATSASAVTDSEQFAQFGDGGTGAGQVGFTRSMATDPSTGYLYLADSLNRRIDEFTAWGNFVKAFGWGVADGAPEFETCTANCQQGIDGSGKGQFSNGSSLAVDGAGNLFVLAYGSHRVQKFDSNGNFVLMFGAAVDKTTGGNICTEASGDECQAGTEGGGPGEFDVGVGLAISTAGTVLVGGEGRIQEFEPDGSFKSEFSVGGLVDAIAPDPTSSALYTIFRGDAESVHKISSSGAELSSTAVYQPQGIATDASGKLYVIRNQSPNEIMGEEQILAMQSRVVQFSPSGSEIGRCCTADPGYFTTALATNSAGDLYVASNDPNHGKNQVKAYGPAPLKFGLPPKIPPTIDGQFLASGDSTSATLKAQINPNYWDTTTFYLEYGTEPCEAGGCAQQPLAPGAKLGSGPVKRDVTSPGVVLTSLQPATTYHYRFVAKTVFGPGEEVEVRGLGGTPGTDGSEATFTTAPLLQPVDSCPANQAFRTGPAANLPDCRAYEMVSPVDKNGGDIATLLDVTGYEARLDQAAVGGDAFTYSSFRSFPGAEGAPYSNQYLAKRGNDGWQSESLQGPVTENFYGSAIAESDLKAFSPDLCQSWLVPAGELAGVPGTVAGFPNLYRRDNCPKGYEALTLTQPPHSLPRYFIPEIQGFAADGSKSVFRVQDNLTPDSPPQPPVCDGEARQCQMRTYEASGGNLSYLCVFPEGTSAKAEAEFPNCSAGSSGFR